MRGVIYVMTALAVFGLAFWAYRENHATQQAIAEMRTLNREIASLREAIGVQRAEWAYLNRPARLHELATLNFDRLELLPMSPDHFGRIDQIAYPDPELPAFTNTVEVFGLRAPQEEVSR